MFNPASSSGLYCHKSLSTGWKILWFTTRTVHRPKMLEDHEFSDGDVLTVSVSGYVCLPISMTQEWCASGMEEPPKSTRSRKVSGMMCEAGRPKNRSPQQRKGGKRALWLVAVVLLLCGRSGPGVCRCLAVGPGLRVPLFRCASFVVAWSFLPALGSFGGTFWTGADPRTAHCWVFR